MRNDLNVPTKNNGADSLELYLFKEQCPPSEHIKSSFRSECPPDKKVKLDNLFEFRRKRGDFVFSVIFLVVALFFFGSSERTMQIDVEIILKVMLGSETCRIRTIHIF